jgi:hypothetical protein
MYLPFFGTVGVERNTAEPGEKRAIVEMLGNEEVEMLLR